MKRFYQEVAVAADNSILLDGKAVKTPARSVLLLPTAGLADAVAGEWRAQGESIDTFSMRLTKLANTAIDRVTAMRGEVIDQILAFGRADLLCYRADFPDALAERQNRDWQPLLNWAAERFSLQLKTGAGIGHIDQSDDAFLGACEFLEAQSDYALAAAHTMVGLLGSLVLTLAVLDGRLRAGEAFRLSRLDEEFQAEQWGQDEEAEMRVRNYAAEMDAAERFLVLSRS